MSRRAQASAPRARRRLAAYRAKRDLRKSGEPAARPGAHAGDAPPRFVIQKHDATRLHYDFRLEMEGVLRSWAVPKGLPTRTGDRALAIEVEDHPLDYGGFEGTIPEGHYGAGTVQLWDRGFYHVRDGDPVRAYRAGHLHLVLAGQKSRGEWTLVRFRGAGNGEKKQWLLIKARTTRAGAAAPKVRAVPRDRSVLTGRTLKEIEAGKNGRPAVEDAIEDEPAEAGEPARGAPRFVEPMKAKPVTTVPGGTEWRLEVKFDGYRALGAVHPDKALLWSRQGNVWADDFEEIVAALRKQCPPGTLVDGEIVVLDRAGRSHFQLLQQRQATGEPVPVHYYVFDLLQANGRSFVREPIERRRAALEKVLAKVRDPIRLSPVFLVPPEQLLGEVRRRGLEGIIAKAPGSRYEPGRRSGAWLKCRIAREQELVIGGYTAPQGARLHFGALLVGYYEGKTLRYAGKVGTGFDAAGLEQLRARFGALAAGKCPFTPEPAMRDAHWLRPQLVAQIRFAEWTQDGRLRHPVFVGLRRDKPAREVVREPLATA